MKKKQWEPETLKGFIFQPTVALGAEFSVVQIDEDQVPARIIREKDFQRLLFISKDYQRLLKIARKAQTPKRTP